MYALSHDLFLVLAILFC